MEVDAMRRLALAVVVAALTALTLAPAATATDNPFAGVWISIDRFDGSTQRLVVSGGSAPAVTYQDSYANTCAVNGSRSTHWVANGRGAIQEEGMAVDFTVAGCGSYRWDGYPAWYFFDSGTLYDNFENAWYRLR
jgi:hypothetical protein